MDFLQAIFLGLVQGLTEWLPVSSSGHLVIAQNLMGLEVPVAFDIALHAGTLLAVLAFFRRDILMLLKSLRKPSLKNPDFRLLFYVILGTIPTAIIGLAFLEFFESL
ncbi:MAG TPA: undecaprenyl-diphosphate phosphatase, partial [archaeon]|nr:undecaprenyl-diphosphate phosphatase [archaeon]